MKVICTGVLASLLLLAGCTAGQPPAAQAPLADHGAAALTPPITTMDAVVDWVRTKTGGCDDAQPAKMEQFTEFVGPQLVGLYEPFVAEWSTCSVPPNYPKVGLVLFKADKMREFQASWREAMAAGTVSDGPSFSFGNGFAVSAGFLGVSDLGLYYLRCNYDDNRVHQVRSDVEGCVFANPEHHDH